MAADGSVKPFDAAGKKRVLDKVDELSEQALRVLAIATRPLGKTLPFNIDADTDIKFDKIVDGLTLCGLCASIDPERDGVKDAVLDSKTAGVRVVMITGDYLKTAIAIAKNINILNRKTFTEGNGEATDCGALRPIKDGPYLGHAEMDNLTKSTSVFAPRQARGQAGDRQVPATPRVGVRDDRRRRQRRPRVEQGRHRRRHGSGRHGSR